MSSNSDENLRYPIGKFQAKESYSDQELQSDLSKLSTLASQLLAAVRGLSSDQLDTPYRDGGWSLRQVIHHLADSHMNAYIRTKWALTEEKPLIKAYNEKDWALTSENSLSQEVSIALIQSLHIKWVELLKTLTPEQLKRSFVHPATNREFTLERMIQMYSWHGEHHLAHLTMLKNKMGW